MIIAIDGPAGSGKSTTARAVADRLGFYYMDTGAMYRAVALALLRAGVRPESAAMAEVVESTRIELSYEKGSLLVSLNGENVTVEIRRPEVSAAVSAVAALPLVRERLVEEQRRLATERVSGGVGVVLDGRDIGTHVFPDAELKIYLIADDATRARRRLDELRAAGTATTYDEVLADLRRRDDLDSTRSIAPLRKADDAVEINTTDLSVDDQVDLVVKLARERSSSQSV